MQGTSQTRYNRTGTPWTSTPTKICRSRRTRASSDVCSATCCVRRPVRRGSRVSKRSGRPRSGFDARHPPTRRGVRAELDALLNDLSIRSRLDVVRAFSYFSHLVNIAEDVHQNRRRRAHALAGSPPQSGQHRARADARRRVENRTVHALARWFANALISPVLTAHPTEVQRKSILDCEREIARLLHVARPRRAHAGRSRRSSRPDSIARCSRCGRPRCCGCRSCR